MKTKMIREKEENVLHPFDEGQKSKREGRKCPSSF
ncbi:hypothetical protein J2S19_002386 [Metabacillus malikii]|uniref:Uncharacterized protein n=1 Tax=Metabacillus malikii TaxID=1504265 RepID=A0ABT9ZGV7_9BACI|nr:hypothetical protein [Metabacillus malikii]